MTDTCEKNIGYILVGTKSHVKTENFCCMATGKRNFVYEEQSISMKNESGIYRKYLL